MRSGLVRIYTRMASLCRQILRVNAARSVLFSTARRGYADRSKIITKQVLQNVSPYLSKSSLRNVKKRIFAQNAKKGNNSDYYVNLLYKISGPMILKMTHVTKFHWLCKN